MTSFGTGLLGCFTVDAFLLAGASFDCLLRWLHTERFDDWLKNGRPMGWITVPPGTNTGRSTLATIESAYRWFFRTPPWTHESPILRRVLWLYRGALASGILGAVWLATALAR